jgi:malate dehydrogenase (oxaloacetate-decarboxylating)(NADP+)
MKKGYDLLHDKKFNKSIAFSRKERLSLGIQGLLPYAVSSQEAMVSRVIENIRRIPNNLEKYMMLSALQDRNANLYYRTVIDHIEEILPLIYTPTVGEACRVFSHISREPKGFFITPQDKGRIAKILGNWPEKDIKVIVVTDGQRILGLGDLGANGMGIPIGKLALYSACAGIAPENCLPVLLDVGTNNEEFLNDILYLGYPHKRISSRRYFDLVEEFVMAVQKKYPGALIQFEDFLTPNAYALLNKYRNRVLCFNDDIQGTAAVALAGVYASLRITKHKFSKLRIMFLGAGSAATGIADLMVAALMDEGLTREAALQQLWFVDVNGLVVKRRKDLMSHNLPYAHDCEQLNFTDAIKHIRPHILIGATGAPGTFSKEVVELMSEINKKPVIFALSNPTSRAECTAEQAYLWSKGQVIFTSGSPFGKVTVGKTSFRPGQGNNVYIFPGVGLGVTFCKAKTIPEAFFLVAGRTLARLVGKSDLDQGSVYPPVASIRKISLAIAVAVAEKAYEMGLARTPRPRDLKKAIASKMYNP